jgi:hypothetical protein
LEWMVIHLCDHHQSLIQPISDHGYILKQRVDHTLLQYIRFGVR